MSKEKLPCDSDSAHVYTQKQYKSDLNWMKGVGWEVSESLDVQQARKAGELISEVGKVPKCNAPISWRPTTLRRYQ